MLIGFSLVFVLFYIYAIVVNWRLLKYKSGQLLFIGLAGLSLGLFVVYILKIGFIRVPADWVVKVIDLYIGPIL